MIDGNQFVGGVTLVLGIVMIASAIANSSFLFELRVPRNLDAKFGRKTARIIIVVLGVGFGVLGIAIAAKWVAKPAENPEASQEAIGTRSEEAESVAAICPMELEPRCAANDFRSWEIESA